MGAGGGAARGPGVEERGRCLPSGPKDPQKTPAPSGALGGELRSLPRDSPRSAVDAPTSSHLRTVSGPSCSSYMWKVALTHAPHTTHVRAFLSPHRSPLSAPSPHPSSAPANPLRRTYLSGVAFYMSSRMTSFTFVCRPRMETTLITRAWASPNPHLYTKLLPQPPPTPQLPGSSWCVGGGRGARGGGGAALPSPLLSLGPWEPGLRGGGGSPQTGNASLGSCCKRAGCMGEGARRGLGCTQGEQGRLGGDW